MFRYKHLIQTKRLHACPKDLHSRHHSTKEYGVHHPKKRTVEKHTGISFKSDDLHSDLLPLPTAAINICKASFSDALENLQVGGTRFFNAWWCVELTTFLEWGSLIHLRCSSSYHILHYTSVRSRRKLHSLKNLNTVCWIKVFDCILKTKSPLRSTGLMMKLKSTCWHNITPIPVQSGNAKTSPFATHGLKYVYLARVEGQTWRFELWCTAFWLLSSY